MTIDASFFSPLIIPNTPLPVAVSDPPLSPLHDTGNLKKKTEMRRGEHAQPSDALGGRRQRRRRRRRRRRRGLVGDLDRPGLRLRVVRAGVRRLQDRGEGRLEEQRRLPGVMTPVR